MKHEVQTSPGLLDTGEDRFELAWLANVTGDDDGAFETFGKRPDGLNTSPIRGRLINGPGRTPVDPHRSHHAHGTDF